MGTMRVHPVTQFAWTILLLVIAAEVMFPTARPLTPQQWSAGVMLLVAVGAFAVGGIFAAALSPADSNETVALERTTGVESP
jgi:Co/Zn/Cd efflux system component